MEIQVDSVDLARLIKRPKLLEGCIVAENEVFLFERFGCHIYLNLAKPSKYQAYPLPRQANQDMLH